MNKFKTIYLSVLSGLILNVFLDFPMMILFHKFGIDAYYGAIFATILCNILSIFIGLYSIKKDYDFKYKELGKTFLKSLISIGGMILSILLLKSLYNVLNLSVINKIDSIIIVSISAIVGGIVYFLISYKIKLIDDIIGSDGINKLIKKLTRKKER